MALCRLGISVLLLCFLLLSGCNDASKDAAEASVDKKLLDLKSDQTKSATQTTKATKQSPPSHQSAIRLRPLSADQFPQVVPDNGARHGFATILESLGSGCAAVDFDRDGWPDVLIAGGGDFEGRVCVGKPVFVLRNHQTHFEDATAMTGIGTTRFYHHGISVADFDHDGFEDFLVTGFGGMQLFCNLGDGTFAESTIAGDLVPGGWSASAAWGDFNQDGHLDVYVTGYVNWSFENDPPCFAADGTTRDNCSPKIFEPLPDTLLTSGGDGTFSDQSKEFKVRPDGKTLGAVAADLNADGYLDLYVGNDVMMNFLYRNETGKEFADWSTFSGAGVSRRGSPDASMGVDVVDFNNDGRFDIWAANFEMESFALYENLGEMQFRHVSDITGVSAIGSYYVGWGTAFTDLDLDGDCDTVVCNGNVVQYPKHSPTLQKMILLENVDCQYFEDVTGQAGDALMIPQHGRGLAWTDWNRDGKVDLLTSPTHAAAQLFENASDVSGRSLTVQLIGTTSPRQPIGTIVELVMSSGTQTKQLIGGGSYASTSLAEIHFGIPEGSIPNELRIKWPSGTRQSMPITEGDERMVVIERQSSF
jgi:hypothetical protein